MAMAPIGQVLFNKLRLNGGASKNTKIDCIQLLWAGAKKCKKFIFAMCIPFKHI